MVLKYVAAEWVAPLTHPLNERKQTLFHIVLRKRLIDSVSHSEMCPANLTKMETLIYKQTNGPYTGGGHSLTAPRWIPSWWGS